MGSMPDAERDVDSRYGWLVVVVSFLVAFLVWGLLFTFTVYSRNFMETFELSRVATSSIYSIGLFSFFVVGGVSGVVTSNMRIRRVVVFLTALYLAGLGLFFVASSYVGLAVAFLGIGAGLGGTYVILIAIVPQWFDTREGLAMGITQAGNGLGLLVTPLLWRWLLGRVDFKTAFLIVGSLVVVSLAAAAIVYRRPREYAIETGEVTSLIDGAWIGRTVRHSHFWLAFAGLGLIFVWYFVLSDQMVDVLTEAGVGISLASATFGLIGGMSVVSRVFYGGLGDRLSLRTAITISTALVVLGSVLLLGRSEPAFLYAAVFCFGFGYGGQAALYSPILVNTFSTAKASGVMGLFMLAEGIAGLIAPPAASYAALAGGYDGLIMVIAVLTALGGLAFWLGTSQTELLEQAESGRTRSETST